MYFRWVPTVNAWLVIVASNMLELIRQKKLWSCAAYETFKDYRTQIKTAAQSLHYKMYEKTSGTDNSIGCNQIQVEYTNRYTKKVYNSIGKETSQCGNKQAYQNNQILAEVTADTNKKLEPLRTRFNETLTVMADMKKLCGAPISNLTKADITYPWPKSCFGDHGDDRAGPCYGPCDYSDSRREWCPREKASKKIGKSYPHSWD